MGAGPKRSSIRDSHLGDDDFKHESDAPQQEQLEIDAQFSHSDVEKLSEKDFDAMTAAEICAAEIAIRTMGLNLPKVPGRRHGLAANAVQIDRRRALQSARRSGGEMIHLPKRRAKPRRLNLVVLCDISGSMTSVRQLDTCHRVGYTRWGYSGKWALS